MLQCFVLAALASMLLARPASAEDAVRVSALEPADSHYLSQQRQRVDELLQRYLGRRLEGEKERDLESLQALLDRDLVRSGQTLELQAMGVVLGDLLATEHRLRWVVYADRLGRSRALQMDKSDTFVFPVTMISRRVDAGLAVEVAGLYRRAVDSIREALDGRYRPAPLIPGAEPAKPGP